MMNSAQPTILNVDLLGNTGASDYNFSVNLSTGILYGIKQVPIEPSANGNVWSLKFSNNAPSAPWELDMAGFYMRDLGLMQP